MSQRAKPEEPLIEGGVAMPAHVDPKTKHAAASNVDYRGVHETDADELAAGRLHTLNISPATADTVPNYPAFKVAFDLYRSPAVQTTQSLAHVRDLVAAGAPRTPDQIAPATRAKFRKIDPTSPEVSRATATNQWVEQQGELKADYGHFMSAKENLESALQEWYAVRERMRQHELEAKRAEDHDRIEEIDQIGKTLASIIEVGSDAGTWMALAEGEFLDVEEDYSEDGVKRKMPSEHLREATKTAGNAFSLEDICVWATGNRGEYQKLQADIAVLDTQLVASGLAEEKHHLAAAKTKLANVRVDINVEKSALRSKRTSARAAAQTFGAAFGGRDETVIVGLAAEAYQELELFGVGALEKGTAAATAMGPVIGWLNDEAPRFREERAVEFDAFADDYRHLGDAVVDTQKTTDYFRANVAVWQATAARWRAFLKDVTGQEFPASELAREKPRSDDD